MRRSSMQTARSSPGSGFGAIPAIAQPQVGRSVSPRPPGCHSLSSGRCTHLKTPTWPLQTPGRYGAPTSIHMCWPRWPRDPAPHRTRSTFLALDRSPSSSKPGSEASTCSFPTGYESSALMFWRAALFRGRCSCAICFRESARPKSRCGPFGACSHCSATADSADLCMCRRRGREGGCFICAPLTPSPPVRTSAKLPQSSSAERRTNRDGAAALQAFVPRRSGWSVVPATWRPAPIASFFDDAGGHAEPLTDIPPGRRPAHGVCMQAGILGAEAQEAARSAWRACSPGGSFHFLSL